MRVLLVEDDVDLSRQLKGALSDAGYAVDHAADGEEAHFLGDTEPYDVVVLDLGLPKIDGVSVLERWRRDGKTTPVLILTARGAWSDKVSGFDAGADDYLTKPFHTEELLARLRALLRRSFNRPEPTLEYRGILLDPVNQQVSYQGAPINLPRKEFVLLHELIAQPGRVLTRDRLQQVLYGWDEEVESNALEVHIHHLRKKFFPELIRTVRGVGYLVDKC